MEHRHGHARWGYTREAFVWHESRPTSINFHPLGTELHWWMRQVLPYLSAFTEHVRHREAALTNPYTYYASTLSLILGDVINAAHVFETSCEELDAIEAEATRIRLSNELALYSSRVCEALIKQLLFVTTVPNKRYEDAPLGQLLSQDCRSCRRTGKPHNVSLLISLAHPYHLCHEFEGCLFPNLSKAGNRRNVIAAHAEALSIEPTGSSDSRERLRQFSSEVGGELLHMLKHISDLEDRIARDLDAKFQKLIGSNESVSSEPQMQWPSAPYDPRTPIPSRLALQLLPASR